MRINEHNLESLRKIVRDLQQENQALKAILEENSIPRIIVCSQSLPVLGKRLCCYGCCGSVYIFLPPDGLRKGLTTASCYFVDQSDTA